MQSIYRKLVAFLQEKYAPDSLFAAVQIFLRERQPYLARASLIHLYRSLDAYGCFLDNLCLSELSAVQVNVYVDELRACYSPGTIRSVIGDLKQFHSWLHEIGRTPENYGYRLKKPKPPRNKHHARESDMLGLIAYLGYEIRPLLYRDVFGNLQIVEDSKWTYELLKSLHDLTAMMLLYETGCRAGELCNISNRQLSRTIQQPALAYTLTVYGKENDRTYRFTNATAELCRLWQQLRPQSTWFFVSWRRGYKPAKLVTSSLSQMLARRCQQAGVHPFRSHAVRHAKVIRSRRLVGLELASRLVDHSSIATTRSYDYIEDDELMAAAILTGHQGILVETA